MNGKKVHIETKVTVITPKKDPEAIKSNDYIERIKLRREYILYYYNSPFRRELKTEKNVRARFFRRISSERILFIINAMSSFSF